MPVLTALILLLTGAGQAAAHGDDAIGAPLGWTFDPLVTGALAAAVLIYVRGYLRLRAQSRLGRRGHDVRALLYASGLLLLVAALVSPLHAAGRQLFTAHMIEHEIIMAVGAPLLVLARPSAAFLWALPDSLRLALGRGLKTGSVRRLWASLATGAVATLLHGMTLWAWHMPALFDAAVLSLFLHRLQHLTFLATALLFWWSMFWRCERGTAAWHVFLTMLHMSLLGALMALSPVVLYTAQTKGAGAFGLTALEDQQLAGLVMWVPAGTVYAAAVLYLLVHWISQSGREALHVQDGT